MAAMAQSSGHPAVVTPLGAGISSSPDDRIPSLRESSSSGRQDRRLDRERRYQTPDTRGSRHQLDSGYGPTPRRSGRPRAIRW